MEEKIYYLQGIFGTDDFNANHVSRHGETKCGINVMSYRLGIGMIQFDIVKGTDEIFCSFSSNPPQLVVEQSGVLTDEELIIGEKIITKWEDLDCFLTQ